MRFRLFDFVNCHGKNEIKSWTKELQKKELAKLNAKLDLLALHGDDLLPDTLANTPTPGVLKLRVHGKVQLRPMLCRGPIDIFGEYTLLIGAFERGGEFDPSKADQIADERKLEINRDPTNRRCKHERVR